MITYVYWFVVITVAVVLFTILARMDHWKSAVVALCAVFIAGWGVYYFHFEKIFARDYGGVMEIPVPDGLYNIGMTWKGNSLWIENYDPKDNTCVFHEYTQGGIWQGKVILRNCSPLFPTSLPKDKDVPSP